MELSVEMLPVCRANQLEIKPPEQLWLIEPLWAHSAVGIIGGAPKCCKSWLGLDMAVSVASATPCLGHFAVKNPGPALIFLAEDANSAVRARIEALCAHRRLDIQRLNLYVITASSLRLDLEHDQKRLKATVAALRPHLLLLDPLVRLHRLDENSAADISKLLGFVREIQRTYDTAIVLVHHASKKHRAHPGQSLRGSSDLHAFGDSNAYLARHKQHIVLTLEHRSAKAIDPIQMQLVAGADGTDTHLQIMMPTATTTAASLAQRTLVLLQNSPKPLPRTIIRKQLQVNNQRLGETLVNLAKQQLILQTPKGWLGLPEAKPAPVSL
jgi:hypothetical protein